MDQVYKILRFGRNIDVKELVELMIQNKMVYTILKCHKCGENLRVYNDTSRMDGCFFAHTRCNVYKSIKSCLWGSDVRLSFLNIILFVQKYCESDDINFLTAITQVDQKIVVKFYAKMEQYDEEILINCKKFMKQKLKACGDVDKIQNFREFRRYLSFDQIFKIVWQTIAHRNIDDAE